MLVRTVLLSILVTFTIQYELSIVHFNDFHARYEPVSNTSGTCNGPKCIGGFSRLYSMIATLKTPNSLVLSAGDNFKGSLWHSVHRWNVTQHFFNKLPLDAMTLGNHEFDDGIGGLVPFLQAIKFPVVVANINSSLEPELNGLFRKSVIVEKGGKKIGIIGVLLTQTMQTSKTEKLTILDEINSINNESQKLKEQVFTTVLISHCGYNTDLHLAANSKFISVIVGGHTDTFLYTGDRSPGPDIVTGPYPTVVTNLEGKQVLVVQASAYSKYLGNLTVFYDSEGNVVTWQGNPIFLSENISTDSVIDSELALWKQQVDLEGEEILGQVMTRMPNKPCRETECFLGNFATDAIISWFETSNSTNISAAILHAGGLRSGIEIGNVTFNHLMTVFPFEETINIIELKGKYIWEMLEKSVSDHSLKFPHLFQVSGLEIVFNISKPENSRLMSLTIRQDEHYVPVNLEENYQLALPTFLTDSGFNRVIFEHQTNKRIGPKDYEVYAKYLCENTPYWGQLKNRTVFV